VPYRPIRVLFLQSHLKVGGAASQVADLISLMDRSRFEPIICCVREAGEYGEDLRRVGFKVYSDLLSFEYDVSVIPKISKIISGERINILFNSGSNRTFMIGYLAAAAAGLKNIVVAIHSTAPANGGNLTGAFTRWVLARVTRMVMVCHAQRRTVCAREGINPAKVTVIHNGA